MLDCEPDGVIIMTGNNEFIESNILQDQPDIVWNLITRRIHGLRMVQWGRRLRSTGARDRADTHSGENFGGDALKKEYEEYLTNDWPLCPRSAPDVAFPDWVRRTLNSKYRNRVVDLYETNLRAMIKKVHAAGCETVLVTVPVNLKDWSPGLSVHSETLDSGALQAWFAEYRQGIRFQMGQEWEPAARSFEAALATDPMYADTYYRLGVCRLQMGETEAAKTAFENALNHDGYVSRCLPVMNATVRRVARESGVPLADLDQDIRKRCASGIPGNEVFLDHVHLNDTGIDASVQSIAEVLCRLWNIKGAEIQHNYLRENEPGTDTIETLRQILRMHLIHNQYDSSLRICRRLDTYLENEIARLQVQS
ncbi:MAG TPA: tetratricopeptide repeat protein, partial [bacterium]|nr:tetratricopeptide repeat protein [bacterium]